MAKVDYSSYFENQTNKPNETKNNTYKVSFFSLKDDGDEAIVRFAYNSIKQFDVETVHKVSEDGKWKSVSCLRNGYEPKEVCPLCASGNQAHQKMYVKLIQYERDEDGKVTPRAKIWERPAEGKSDFAKELSSYLAEYGDLTNYVFKIKRFGARGSLGTTYQVIPTNQAMYSPEIYTKDFSAFEGYDLVKNHVINVRTFDEMKGGSTPSATPTQTVTPTQTAPVHTMYVGPNTTGPQPTPTQPTRTVVGSSEQSSTPSGAEATRPIRHYDF